MDAKLVAAAMLVFLTGGLLVHVLGSPSPEQSTDPLTSDIMDGDEVMRTADGTKYTVHPDELLRGCSGMDCIPSIDDPSFTDIATADEWLAPEDLVMTVEHNSEVKAYPLRILNLHEIVNDEVGGEPVAVTYCPLCRSGVAYKRTVGDTVLEFGVSGKLYNANLIMYDRQTKSYWSQIGGEAVVGDMVPTELEPVRSSVTKWEQWKQAHPESPVLSRDTGAYPTSYYGRNPYSGYETRSSVGFGVDEVDNRLHSKALVWGVAIGNRAVAYPEQLIREQRPIRDEVGGVPVLVFEHPDDGTVQVIIREIDGSTIDLGLTDSMLVADDGRSWALDGTPENADIALEKVHANGFFWFAWEKFHPDTRVYGQDQ